MKRSTKHLSDIDQRGRVRRTPKLEAAPMVNAKFLDGPAAGQTLPVPRGADTVKIGPFRYSFAGREGQTTLFCRHPKSRFGQHLLLSYIGKHGRDPRRVNASMRREPVKRTAPSKHGQGARRRAERTHAEA